MRLHDFWVRMHTFWGLMKVISSSNLDILCLKIFVTKIVLWREQKFSCWLYTLTVSKYKAKLHFFKLSSVMKIAELFLWAFCCRILSCLALYCIFCPIILWALRHSNFSVLRHLSVQFQSLGIKSVAHSLTQFSCKYDIWA